MASLKSELKLQFVRRNISVGAQMKRAFGINARAHVLLRTLAVMGEEITTTIIPLLVTVVPVVLLL